MSNYVGDFAPSSTVTIYFTTVAAATGLPTALAGAATAAAYNGTMSSAATAGVTLAVTTASNAGHNNISIDTSQDTLFFAAGNDYAVSLTSGSVGGTSVRGYNVGHFSLNNRGIRANVIQVNGTAAATSSAQLGVNLVTVGGAAVAAASGILQTNTVQWLGPAPLPLTAGLAVQSAQVGNISGSVGSVVGAVGSVTARVTANTDQVAGATVNALISGRIDASVGQVQTSAIGPAAYVAGALGTTVFASQFLTSALIDTTYPNALADALLDRSNAIETAITPRKALRYEVAAAAGALSGAGTTQVNIWGAGVATTRITAITDQSGNRASVTLA